MELEQLAERAAASRRVAICGVDGAGKTTVAAALAPLVAARGRTVARVSIDDFHRPEPQRYARGRLSAQGYYEDCFDFGAFRRAVETVDADVAIAEGVFLFRPELDDLWDLRIWLDVDPGDALRRALARDSVHHESQAELRELYERRYLPGQQLYLDAVRPRERADILFP